MRYEYVADYLNNCITPTLKLQFQIPGEPIDKEDYDMGGVLATPKPVQIELRPRF